MLRKSMWFKAMVGGLLLAPTLQGCSQETMEVHETSVGAGSPRTSEPGTSAAAPPGSEGTSPGGGSPAGNVGSNPADSVKGTNVGAGDPSTGTSSGPSGDAPSKPH
jgi:hypothetical protein